MISRFTRLLFITSSILGLSLLSVSAHAGSFKDFILDEGVTEASRFSDRIPARSQSASCMQCHNGSSAKAISIKHAETTMVFTNHGSSNHPVGMYYESYARKSPSSYIASARLDPRVKLENGQVTCVSCHQTRTHKTGLAMVKKNNDVNESCGSTKKLTTGSNQTRLCMSCHAM